jgi:hypothetical protein
MIEIYGHSLDAQDTPASLKALLDKKAQSYWQRSGKLHSVGKSIQMLMVDCDPSETLFVPQGTQTTAP